MDQDEEGQIIDDLLTQGEYYDREYEWPAEYEDAQTSQDGEDQSKPTQTLKHGQPICRFVALRSAILPAEQKIAILDAYPEVQIGRDKQLEGSSTPRIRLKEMAVSKLHATAYWDGTRKEWNIVDMGSMHGTYLHSGPVSPESNDVGVRLSQPRSASIPRRLRHSDRLTIGGTTFEVHIHESNQRPCEDCAVLGKAYIPLFPAPRKTAMKRTRSEAGIDPATSSSFKLSTEERDPKRALNLLKRSLLTRHDVSQPPGKHDSPASVERRDYVDRAARRRLLHPSHHDSPGTPTPPLTITPKSDSPPVVPYDFPPPPIIPASSTPLPSSNIGHRLLLQQGWTPGNALGAPPDSPADRVGLVNPLEVKSSQHRAGLGMKQTSSDPDLSASGLTWKDHEKFKRFSVIQGG